MIKHSKVFPFKGVATTHLKSVKHLVTRGIADAKEGVTLHPKKCDVIGAKRHSVEECVLAKTAFRELKPDVAIVGRSLAYLIFKGLAIRFRMSRPGTRVAEEFDSRGRARLAPVELLAINKTWRLGTAQRGKNRPVQRGGVMPRARKMGVRAVGGGITA